MEKFGAENVKALLLHWYDRQEAGEIPLAFHHIRGKKGACVLALRSITMEIVDASEPAYPEESEPILEDHNPGPSKTGNGKGKEVDRGNAGKLTRFRPRHGRPLTPLEVSSVQSSPDKAGFPRIRPAKEAVPTVTLSTVPQETSTPTSGPEEKLYEAPTNDCKAAWAIKPSDLEDNEQGLYLTTTCYLEGFRELVELWVSTRDDEEQADFSDIALPSELDWCYFDRPAIGVPKPIFRDSDKLEHVEAWFQMLSEPRLVLRGPATEEDHLGRTLLAISTFFQELHRLAYARRDPTRRRCQDILSQKPDWDADWSFVEECISPAIQCLLNQLRQAIALISLSQSPSERGTPVRATTQPAPPAPTLPPANQGAEKQNANGKEPSSLPAPAPKAPKPRKRRRVNESEQEEQPPPVKKAKGTNKNLGTDDPEKTIDAPKATGRKSKRTAEPFQGDQGGKPNGQSAEQMLESAPAQ